MADYYPILARAIASLDQNTAEARRGVYERARTAIVKQLRGYEPPLSESEITRERLALEDAIRRIDAEHRSGRGPHPAQMPAPATPLQTVREAAADADHLGPAAAAAQMRAAADRAALDGQPAPQARQEPLPAPLTPGGGANVPSLQGESGASEQSATRRTPAIVGIIVVLLLAGAGAVGVYLGGNHGAQDAEERLLAEADAPPKITDRISPEETEQADGAAAPAETEAAPAEPETVTPSEERAPPTAGSAQPSSPAGPSSSAAPAASPVAQQAVLYAVGAEGTGETANGSVAWNLRSQEDRDTGAIEQVFTGLIDIPEHAMQAEVKFERNTDPTLPSVAYIVDIEFRVPQTAPFKIASVPGVAVRRQLGEGPEVFQSEVVRVNDNLYSAALLLRSRAAGPQAAAINDRLLREAALIDVLMVYEDGRQAVLMMDLGVAGRQALTRALTGWQQAAQNDAARSPATGN